MQKICRSVLVLPLLLIIFQTGGQDLDFWHLTTEQGLSSNTIYIAFKDSLGFMWFNTSAGLCRYDGYNIKVFTSDPADSTSLSSNFLYSEPLVDKNGYIWIGTFDNGLCKYDPAGDGFIQFKHDPANECSLDNNRVWTVYQDKSGTIWIGTETALNRFDQNTGNFQHWSRNPDDQPDPSNRIYSMLDDENNVLWLTTGKGAAVFDREKQTFTSLLPESELLDALNNQSVFKIIQDSDGDYWFGAEKGLFFYDAESKRLKLFSSDIPDKSSLSGTLVYHILQDPVEKSTFWVTSFWGLNKINKYNGNIEWIMNDPEDPYSLGSNLIYWTYVDRSGLIWVATENAGIAVADLYKVRQKRSFNHILLKPIPPDTIGYSATAFAREKSGNLWVGTAEGGLYQFDERLEMLSVYQGDLQDQKILKNSFILNLTIDSFDNLLVGTTNNGLLVFDRKSGQLTPCKFLSPGSTLYDAFVQTVFQDDQGTLWVGTISGLYYSGENISISYSLDMVPHDELKTANIKSIYEDSAGNLWIGTIGNGLYCLCKECREQWDLQKFENITDNPQSLSSNMVFHISEGPRGTLWIGTANGLNKFFPESRTFETILFPDHPGINFIYSTREDNDGNLWLTSEGGLVRFDPSDPSGRTYNKYGTKDGLPMEEIFQVSLFCNDQGRIFLGSNPEYGRGFFTFDPDSLITNTQKPPVVLTDFRVHNEAFRLDSSISFRKLVRLNYDENFLSFEFSALDYKDPLKNQYAYMLEGIDHDWVYSGNRHFANYAGLKPGKYTFKAKGSNNDGIWNETGTRIAIVISPPPWKTWWAYSSYLILLIIIVISWRRYDLKRQRMKHQLQLEHLEGEKLKELDQVKSRFFANISHEFRTPLTLILGLLEKISHKNGDEEFQQDLRIARRSARNLHKLVDELLSLSKLEAGQMKLQATEEDLVRMVREYIQLFESLARKKKITFSFDAGQEQIKAYIDKDKMGKILSNILSNAFKFTPEGGRVAVSVVSRQSSVVSNQSSVVSRQSPVVKKLTEDFRLKTVDLHDNSAIISVSDTGPGIQQEHLPRIFDRFYQADDSSRREHEGTGIGLALTRELVTLHHGRIAVESEVGKGTTFTVILPLGKEHLKPGEIMTADIPEKGVYDPAIPVTAPEQDSNLVPGTASSMRETPPVINHAMPADDQLPLLLLVEDNEDLRHFMRDFLSRSYHLLEAEDGEDGLKKALDAVPDIVVSDVMMPRMDGIELCNKLKNDERTCHIPVILLTAKAAQEDKITGLETGADDFITKPFDQQELLIRIKNLVQQRKKLKAVFLQNLGTLSRLTDISIASMDKKFIQKAVDIIENHLSDADFSVESFSHEIGMSRGQLHRKLRGLIGQSPGDLIRILRLNRAAIMLKARTGTIAEIAYDVGFNNPSYFSECFRKQFGMLPSEYASD